MKLFEAAGRHEVARLEALSNFRHSRIRSSRLDRLNPCHSVPDHVDEGLLSVVLNRVGGNQRHALQCSDQESRVHELVRKKGLVPVLENGAQLYGSRGGIDLVIKRQELARGDLRRLGAIVSIHSQSGSLTHLRLYLTDAVFRDRKNGRDRLDLRDHHEWRAGCACLIGLNQVARVDQTQAHAPGDWSCDVTVAELYLGQLHGALVEL